MDNYFLYFPVSEKDESWGLTGLNVGNSKIEKFESYTPTNHPSHHNFSWDTGRVMQKYQLIYSSGFLNQKTAKKRLPKIR